MTSLPQATQHTERNSRHVAIAHDAATDRILSSGRGSRRDATTQDAATCQEEGTWPGTGHDVTTRDAVVNPSARRSLVERYREAFLAHAPDRCAVMQSEVYFERTGKKYNDYPRPISIGEIRDHLTGKRTYAVPATRDGLTRWGAIDIDSHAAQAVPALLAECDRRGISAVGIIQDNDRAYVQILCAELVAAEQLQRLLKQVIAAVQRTDWDLDPRATNADTRLPFGKHQWTGTYGTLVLASGELSRIDDNPGAAQERALDALQPFDPALLPAIKPTEPKRRAVQPGASVIAAFKQQHDIADLLLSYGAKRAGRDMYLCPFHEDRHASLKVFHDTNRCICHSRNSMCPLSGDHSFDAFNVYCIGEALTPSEAVKRLAQNRPHQAQLSGTTRPSRTVQPEPAPTAAITLDTIAQATAPKQTLAGAWYTDRALREYIKEHGSPCVVMVHLAREKLGEDATHAAVNAEIARRRGKPYTDRHLRRSNSKRRLLIEQWDAEKAPQGGDILSADAVYKELSINLACEGGETTATIEPLDADEPQEALPIETPPIATVAPLTVSKQKRKRAGAIKTATIADIPELQRRLDRAHKAAAYWEHLAQCNPEESGLRARARAMRRDANERYGAMIAYLQAQAAALQPSWIDAPVQDSPPSQADPVHRSPPNPCGKRDNFQALLDQERSATTGGSMHQQSPLDTTPVDRRAAAVRPAPTAVLPTLSGEPLPAAADQPLDQKEGERASGAGAPAPGAARHRINAGYARRLVNMCNWQALAIHVQIFGGGLTVDDVRAMIARGEL